MPAQITPLDPDSEHGREVTARVSQVLAEIFNELDDAKAAAGQETGSEMQDAA